MSKVSEFCSGAQIIKIRNVHQRILQGMIEKLCAWAETQFRRTNRINANQSMPGVFGVRFL